MYKIDLVYPFVYQFNNTRQKTKDKRQDNSKKTNKMQYSVFELMFNTNYLTHDAILSFRCINSSANQAYQTSNIKRQVSAHMLGTAINNSGICSNDFDGAFTCKDLAEAFNNISEQYYENLFGVKVRISFVDHLINDKLYPMSLHKVKNGPKPLSVLRLNRSIRTNRNVDAILNYANPPKNRQYSLYDLY